MSKIFFLIFIFFLNGCVGLHFVEGYTSFHYKNKHTNFYIKSDNTKQTSSIYHKLFLDNKEPLFVYIDKNKHSKYIKIVFLYREYKGVYFDNIKISNTANEEILFTLKRNNEDNNISYEHKRDKLVNISLNNDNIEKLLKILLSDGKKKLSLFNKEQTRNHILSKQRLKAIVETFWLYRKTDINF